jgi:hypothetical protein
MQAFLQLNTVPDLLEFVVGVSTDFVDLSQIFFGDSIPNRVGVY